MIRQSFKYLKKKGLRYTARRAVYYLAYPDIQLNPPDPDFHVAQDWDNLLILDGCRADLFEDVAELQDFDSYDRLYSTGSASREWVEENFEERELGDTIYISANPFVVRLAGNSFHELIDIHQTAFDDELGTIPAGAVAKEIKKPSKSIHRRESSPISCNLIIHSSEPTETTRNGHQRKDQGLYIPAHRVRSKRSNLTKYPGNRCGKTTKKI